MNLKIINATKMQGRLMSLLAEPDDIQWLWEGHLKSAREPVQELGYEAFKSYVMSGFHESAPEFIYLFLDTDPNYDDLCLEIDLREENTGCHEEKPYAGLSQEV